MATTFISTNTIGAGTQFNFGAIGDNLVVLPNVTLGSSSGAAITTGFTDTDVTIMGNLVSVSMLLMTQDSGFTVTSTGSFVSVNPSVSSAAIDLVGNNASIQIDGSLTAQDSIGILMAGVGSSVTVTGSVSGGSAGVFMALFGAANNQLVNSGTISAGSVGDVANDARFNNGVLAEGANTRITNLAGGTITAVSSEGAGVRLAAGGGGTVVSNAGSITALNWYGVDFSLLGVAETARLYNSGVIQGLAGAFIGNDTVDNVTNRGAMIGEVVLGDGSDLLDGRGGRFDGVVFGGNGEDRMDFRGAGLVSDTILGGAGFDTILGTEGDDTISGEAEGDVLSGGGGEDVLFGGDGNDVMRGGAGDDTIDGGFGTSVLLGGLGDDLITGGLLSDNIFGGDGNDSLHSLDDTDIVQGGAGDDQIDLGNGDDTGGGGQGDDTLAGGAGADSLDGNAGADSLQGDSENDTLNGGEGNDTLSGGSQNDRLTGGGGDDLLDGGTERDTMFGNGGSDTLVGGQSFDTMTGGQGSDVFVFALGVHIGTALGARDVILDFRAGIDVVDLTDIDANTTLAANQAFAFIGAGAFTSVAGQLRYSAVDGLLQGDADGNGVADFSLDLATRPALTVLDILL